MATPARMQAITQGCCYAHSSTRPDGVLRPTALTSPAVAMLLTVLAAWSACAGEPAARTSSATTAAKPRMWIRFESDKERDRLFRRLAGVEPVGESAGALVLHGASDDARRPAADDASPQAATGPSAGAGFANAIPNARGGWFDGRRSIALTRLAGDDSSLREGFTWEGFFWLDPKASLSVDGAVAGRIVSQFVDERGTSTRLAIGLSPPASGKPPRLCLAFAGTANLFVGKTDVRPARWHHFAVVHIGRETDGELRWYLDYRLQGIVRLDGRSDRSQLKPPGPAPFAIGARTINADGRSVDRGFPGVLDEIRFHAEPLEPEQLLRAHRRPPKRPVRMLLVEDLDSAVPPTELLERLSRAALAPHAPPEGQTPAWWDESLPLQAFALTALPPRLSGRGFPRQRTARTAVVLDVTSRLPKAAIELWVRTRHDLWLFCDGRRVVSLTHTPVAGPLDPVPRPVQEMATTLTSDGKPQRFTAVGLIEPDDADGGLTLAVAWRRVGDDRWYFLGAEPQRMFDAASWATFEARLQSDFAEMAPQRRLDAQRRGRQRWELRHQWAAREAARWGEPFERRLQALRAAASTENRPERLPADGRPVNSVAEGARQTPRPARAQKSLNPIDLFLDADFRRAGIRPAPLVDDVTFLRRLWLDARGRIPTLDELRRYAQWPVETRRRRAIELALESEEWADAWTGYWQDVLAENPTILKPDMNNSGPFRWWIAAALRENRPWDRVAHELLRMEGPDASGGTAGFALAAKNDAPMAMKAHVVLQAFAAVDLKCARCHDSPLAPLTQRDLFSVAAMLNEGPLTVPASSVIPTLPGARQPAVTKSLAAGEKVLPAWPLQDRFEVLEHLTPAPRAWRDTRGGLPRVSDSGLRDRLAAILTDPSSRRFSDVLVNRVWRRYFGRGFVEPVDDWNETHPVAHPDLFGWLSWQFVANGYDLKWLARTIFSSHAYQRQACQSPEAWTDTEAERLQGLFASQLRRRLTAEQIVDSLHTAVGKPFEGEELTFDPAGKRGFLNLGLPRRAWQMTSMSNERDRPALAMPLNQAIVDVLTTFGWRETRPTPLTVRDHSPNPLQPLMLANGLLVWRLLRLTEDSPLTERCLEVATPEELVDELFLRTLSRAPTEEERQAFAAELREVFAGRKTGKPKARVEKIRLARVDWEKHLKPEATLEILEAARRVRAGEPPTVRLTTEFRQRVEDMLWALVNAPEFVFIP